MTDKASAVGKGDNAEKAYDRIMKSHGWKAVAKSTRSMVRINGRFVQTAVDLFGAFDRIYVRDDGIEFAQITVRSALSSHKKRIMEKFPVVFTLPGFSVTIPLWRSVRHGKVERYEFDVIGWVWSADLGDMVWIERRGGH